MKKHLLTIMFVLGLSAAVAFAQGGAGSAATPSGAQSGQTGSGSQMGQQSQPMSEQQPDMSQNKKSSSMANVDDESLHRQVHEQLASNPDLQNVQVSVSNGVVSLDGTVPNKRDKKEAKKLAKSVPGVRSVKEHLTISASASAATPSSTGGVSGQTSSTATGSENQPSSQSTTGAVAGQTGATTGTTTGSAASSEIGQSGSTSSQTGTTSGAGQTGTATSEMGQTSTAAGANAGQPCNAMSSQGSMSGQTSASGQTGAAASGSVTSQIQSELCKDPSLSSTDVSVSQQGSQIILSGTVPSTEAKDKASDIAMRYANGMSLVNNIQVSGQGGASTPPSTAGGVSGSVGGANPSAPSSTEQPAISGQAGATSSTTGQQPPSVSGQAGVGAQTPESGAAAGAGAQTGATATTGAQSSSGMSTADDQLKTQIETALRQEPTLSNDNINVNISSDQIDLSGTVANGKDRQTAKRIAESFAGNRKVVDHLTVSGEGSKSGQTPPENK